MNNSPFPRSPSESYLRHKRDLNRRIVLPLILATLIVIGVSILIGYATFSADGDVERWSQIATIWIIAPLMAFALVILILLIALVGLMMRLLQITPRYTNQAQTFLLWLTDTIKLWADRIVQPTLTLKTWLGLFSKDKQE
jgi:hypothetical protein